MLLVVVVVVAGSIPGREERRKKKWKRQTSHTSDCVGSAKSREDSDEEKVSTGHVSSSFGFFLSFFPYNKRACVRSFMNGNTWQHGQHERTHRSFLPSGGNHPLDQCKDTTFNTRNIQSDLGPMSYNCRIIGFTIARIRRQNSFARSTADR